MRQFATITPPHPLARGMRIGLLGGSFNPAHRGHVHVSEIALKRLKLDRVWWMVSPRNPLKPARGMAAFEKRLAGAKTMARHPRLCVTGIEAALGTRYTADTLAELKRRFPGVRFVWLMGTDNLIQIPHWRNWRAIFRAVPVAIAARPGTALRARASKAAKVFASSHIPETHAAALAAMAPPAWTILDEKRCPASATAIRGRANAWLSRLFS